MALSYRDPDRTALAVLGSPIAHSLSPTLHSAAYAELGLPFSYNTHEVPAGGLAAFVAGLGPRQRGLSLTMPLKREVLPLLDRTTALVDELGVANTLLLRSENDRIIRAGANTDVEGLVRPISAIGCAPVDVTILGGGATAVSALMAAFQVGARLARVFVRNPGRAEPLTTLATRLGVAIEVHPLIEVSQIGPLGFVISTLPGGVADDLSLVPTNPDAVLFDVTYKPSKTAIASRWKEAGGRVLSGLDMLTEQAIGQIRFFLTGDQDEPLTDEDEVRRSMRIAIGLPPTITPSAVHELRHELTHHVV